MNMFVSGAALLLACSAFAAYDLVTVRASMVNNLSIQAQMIGTNTVSALLFGDPESAQKTLSALKAAPHVVSAGIYTMDGRPFASYFHGQAGHAIDLPTRPSGQVETHSFKNGELILIRSIVFQGSPTGTVYIRADLREINERLKRYAIIAAAVLLVCLIAALLVSRISQKAISKPITDLAAFARIVSRDRNFSVRAAPNGERGELAILIDAFNEMLAQIQQSEAALLQSHDQLDQRVKDRTAELETAKEEVERASKFKDQFLSTMSHELRTPLNAVLGFSDLLADPRYGPLNERQQRYVNHIHTGGNHLLKLISDILDLSKIEAGRMEIVREDVAVAPMLSEVLNALQPLADKKSQRLVQQGEANLYARADATRFKQVLMNLVGNAIKFTPDGGRIELAARQAGGQVRVEVRDNGPGIPPEDQQRIFEAFYRRAQAGVAIEGTGLGLAITERLVQMHGSQLQIESEPGKGTCFHFSLPLVAIQPEQPAEATTVKRRAGKAPQVLIIEDDVAARQLIESQLTSAGYEAFICDQPERAVNLAAEVQPDAITLDLLMKPVHGLEVLLQLKNDQRTSKIPVIVVTIVDQRAIGTALGADEYLIKPVEKTALLAAIERCLKSRGGAAPARPILVVEDDGSSREMIAELLTTRGYTVTTAADGAQARERVAHALPELVILDLMLPKISGFELLAEWRANPRTSDLPVFVLTSKDLSTEEQRYICAQAESLFRKQHPWQEELLQQLQRVISPAQLENA
jgi:signal transduction histidine kinase/DNA-binding response OmpR family regulator